MQRVMSKRTGCSFLDIKPLSSFAHPSPDTGEDASAHPL
jgi:hypothetical protein